MSEITVRALEPTEWEKYKACRLTALQEAPDAFAADYDTEAAYEEALWLERMGRATRVIAETAKVKEAAGIVSLRPDEAIYENALEAFGLWVAPDERGTGVATALMEFATAYAADAGHGSLIYWVGTDNGRAVAFASSFGFRPTEYRRPMEHSVDTDEDDEEELAMVYALRP
ncbi:MAG: GNAT family N-acetyltransferase [Austwickia sp.]|jgi:GNAT superfamily N-acetyltransferase|nr:GNAT family N-acetyltransferase [Austwickia sp.]MBK8436640.1 GNAT family N-acetyltransferase [Austwickia sp.]MBK9100272.1 GNAT family N-acetyltransferase [Austwickia sp.]